ncbi:MAG: DinB family protein [Caldilineaceae bacterium]
MLPFFADYIALLQTLHEDIKNALEDLPQAALDWVPGDEMNSLAVLIAHVAGSEKYWIGDVLARGATQRVRDTEFQTGGLGHAALLGLLDDALADSQQAVATLTLEDLHTSRPLPGHENAASTSWCLLHALEHVATHLGHIQLARQVWLQQQGSTSHV